MHEFSTGNKREDKMKRARTENMTGVKWGRIKYII